VHLKVALAPQIEQLVEFVAIIVTFAWRLKALA
jgi:hypothetical protein